MILFPAPTPKLHPFHTYLIPHISQINESLSRLETSPRHDGVELFLTDQPIIVDICSFDHLLQLWIIDVFSHLLHYSPQIFDRDKAGFLVVEQCEDSLQVLLWIFVGETRCQKIEKLREVDVTLNVGNGMKKGLVFALVAKSRHRGKQFLITVFVPLG